ncbi:MAG TPA: cysteine hydrolase family protein [Anaerovoracaceae bacterium]|nr:cysteine hydrolase family protein [Anaerovoracaceae bacterium]
MNRALILIDIQNDYFKGGKNELYMPEHAATNASRVLEYFRNKGLPVYHVQHINIREGATFFLPDSSGVEIHACVKPYQGEKIFIKHVPNSFFNTGLADELKAKQIDHLTVCGMMSHMCIDTSVRAAKDMGFSMAVLEDACTTKDLIWDNSVIPASMVHNTIMASLQGIFAQVLTVDEFFISFD